MKRIGFIIITLALMGYICLAAPLNEDKAIYRKGLPCGLDFYIITNPVEKTSCEIALVYKGDCFYSFVDSLSRISSPYRFLENKGVTATLASEGENNFLLRFEDINTAKPEIIDSTLLLVFNIIADDPAPRSLKDYAIIVSGDVDKKNIEEKIKIFSLFLLKKNNEPHKAAPYEFIEGKQPDVQIVRRGTDKVTFTFRSPRRDLSNTPALVHLFSEKLNIEMSNIIKTRIKHTLLRATIPFKSIEVAYLSSADNQTDEQLSITIDATFAKDICKIVRLCVEDIVSLKAYHFANAELKQAESIYYQTLFSRENISNHKYVSLCANNFHYGGAIIPPAEKLKYLNKKVITDSLQREMMIQHIDEVVHTNGRLGITVETLSKNINQQAILDAIKKGEKPNEARKHVTLAMCLNRENVIDRKSVAIPLRTDGSFQGTIFKCTNGIELLYKPMKKVTKYHINYSIPNNIFAYGNLPQGSVGMIGDLVLNGTEDYLKQNNITLTATATATEFCFTAVAEQEKLDSLFLLLSILTSKRNVSEKELNYFVDCHKKDQNAKGILDSLLFPEFRYCPSANGRNLGGLTVETINAYITTLCANRTKGKILVVGPEDEENAGKELGRALSCITPLRYLEGTKIKANAPNIKSKSYVFENHVPRGNEANRLNFVYTFKQELDSDTHFWMLVGSNYLENEINKILATSPYSCTFEHYWSSFPEARYYFYAYIRKNDINVVSAAKRTMALSDIQAAIAARLKGFTLADVSTADLEAIKKKLASELDANQNRPDYWLEIMNIRRTERKNLNTKYQEKLKAVSAQDIVSFYKSLLHGSVAVFIE